MIASFVLCAIFFAHIPKRQYLCTAIQPSGLPKTLIKQLKITRMKKLLIVALCLLGICNARAEMMTAQEIILTEAYHMQPWDSKDDETIIH